MTTVRDQFHRFSLLELTQADRTFAPNLRFETVSNQGENSNGGRIESVAFIGAKSRQRLAAAGDGIGGVAIVVVVGETAEVEREEGHEEENGEEDDDGEG